jgi:nitrogen regulatory protein PII-like uncharacterized protein
VDKEEDPSVIILILDDDLVNVVVIPSAMLRQLVQGIMRDIPEQMNACEGPFTWSHGHQFKSHIQPRL